MDKLKGLKVAILVTDGFEQVELTRPQKALDVAGAETRIVSPKTDRVRGWNFTEWGEEFPVDVPLARTSAQEFDALLLPGGVMNPDTLRMQRNAVEFVKAFFDLNKPVAVSNPTAQTFRRDLQCGLALHSPLSSDDRDALCRLFVSVEALGQFRAVGPAPVTWDVVPGLHWKPAENWRVSGALIVPFERSEGQRQGWQVTAALQF